MSRKSNGEVFSVATVAQMGLFVWWLYYFALYVRNISCLVTFVLFAALQTCEIIMERNVSSDVQITDDTRLRERVSNANWCLYLYQCDCFSSSLSECGNVGCGLGIRKVKFSHTHYRALGPELIPVYRQSARMWREVNHTIDLAVGCRYFLPCLWLPL